MDIRDGNINVHLDLSDFDEKFKKAQLFLDQQVMSDMIPYMPMVTGVFINNTIAISQSLAGTGKVCAGAPPMGRFLYEGKVMVDPETGSPWARAGAKKVVTDRDLVFQRPNAEAHWFEKAKSVKGNQWVKGVAKIVGGKVDE